MHSRPRFEMDDQQFLRRLGNALRVAREARSLSQEGLADACGLHRTYVGSVERGERNISVLNLRRMCASLGVSLGEVLTGAAERTR